MSYRTIKKLLGETSLERKCRFLLGAGMLLLITISFSIYSKQNTALIYEQNLRLARTIVAQELIAMHWGWEHRDDDDASTINEFQAQMRPAAIAEMDVRLSGASTDPNEVSANLRALSDEDYQILDLIRGGASEYVEYDKEADKFRFHQAITITESCTKCHYHQDAGHQDGQIVAMSSLTLPLEEMAGDLEFHRAILIATALVTAFLAMLGAYAIVRYVIVKPILHLKDVSDEIARGNLDLRADIRTGDEFEELSHAFNRMLRHLVTVQEELKHVNSDLDGKVDELAHVNLQLYETNKLKDEFLATMSHELRTPLNSILGFSDVLADAGNLEDKQHRYVSNIQTSGRQLMSLINDILDLAKIESGKTELQLVEFDLSDFIERQIGTMQPLADRKNIDLAWKVDSELEDVFQDRGKLQQVLNNLLSNALKFTPEGGRVSLHARSLDEDQMLLLVRDTGVGIRLEDQEQIFEKFRQGKALPGQRDALTREYGGTGLGLSIVKELTRLLGGEVELESEFGKGSTFSVRIPIRLEPTLPSPETDPVARYAGLNRLMSQARSESNGDDSPRTADLPKPSESDTESAPGESPQGA